MVFDNEPIDRHQSRVDHCPQHHVLTFITHAEFNDVIYAVVVEKLNDCVFYKLRVYPMCTMLIVGTWRRPCLRCSLVAQGTPVWVPHRDVANAVLHWVVAHKEGFHFIDWVKCLINIYEWIVFSLYHSAACKEADVIMTWMKVTESK